MLAAIFIQGGIAALKSPQDHLQAAKPVLDAVSPVLERTTNAAAPVLDQAAGAAPVDVPPTAANRLDDETIVRIDGGVKLVAGTMLALGKFPRLASTALAASLIPTTVAGHRFWQESDPDVKAAQQLEFLKNLGLLGGLLIAAADTEGRPSLAWRGRKAAKLAAAAAATQAGAVSGAVEDVTDRVSGAVEDVSGKVSGAANEASGTLSGLAAGAAGLLPAAAASSRGSKSGPSLAEKASDLTGQLTKRADKAAARAAKRGAALQEAAQKRANALQKAADKQSARLQKRAAQQGNRLSRRAERRRADAEKKTGFFDQVVEQAGKLGQDVAARASAAGDAVAQQADGAVRDTRERAEVVSR
jgi:uncharacterized membrane protein YphA (DoxX/SURF4 family)